MESGYKNRGQDIGNLLEFFTIDEQNTYTVVDSRFTNGNGKYRLIFFKFKNLNNRRGFSDPRRALSETDLKALFRLNLKLIRRPKWLLKRK